MKTGDKFYCIKELYRESCGYPLIVGKVYKIEKILQYAGNKCGIIVKNPHHVTNVFENWMFYNGFEDRQYNDFFDYFSDSSHPVIRKLKLETLNKIEL